MIVHDNPGYQTYIQYMQQSAAICSYAELHAAVRSYAAMCNYAQPYAAIARTLPKSCEYQFEHPAGQKKDQALDKLR